MNIDIQTYEHASPRNPLRRVDWRWARAGAIASGQAPFNSRRDDAWVRRAAKFRRAVDAAQSAYDFARLADAQPEAYYAYRLWKATERETAEAAYRYGVEARLLARSSDAEIAERTGLHEDDVAAYAALFFDVRGRLDRRDFILNMVIGPAVHRGLNTRDYDLLWKLFGYMRGPHVLDALIATFEGAPESVPLDDVAAALARGQAFDAARMAAYATKSLRVLVETQSDVVGLYYKLKELERAGGRDGGRDDALMGQISAFLSAADVYQIGPPAAGEGSPFDALSYEPSTAALLAGDVDEDDAELAALDFPAAAPTA